jgi:hypothetical protein
MNLDASNNENLLCKDDMASGILFSIACKYVILEYFKNGFTALNDRHI